MMVALGQKLLMLVQQEEMEPQVEQQQVVFTLVEIKHQVLVQKQVKLNHGTDPVGLKLAT